MYDVIVVGGGPAGLGAAIGAARQGGSVLLVEEDALLGGAVVDYGIQLFCGVTTDRLFTEFSDRLAELDPWYASGKEDPLRSKTFRVSHYLQVIDEMTRPLENLTVKSRAHFVRTTVAETAGRRRVTGIEGITLANGRETAFRANGSVIVDCTGDGAAAAASGAESMFGREARSEYDEPHAPDEADARIQQMTWMYTAVRTDDTTDFNPGGFRLGERQRLIWGPSVNCSDPTDSDALNAAQQEVMEKLLDKWRGYGDVGWEVSSIAPRLGVRETRRIVGEYVLTEQDMIAGRDFDDAVVRGNFVIDPHEQDRPNPMAPVETYTIPYRSLIPKGIEGLLVAGRCLSGTHVALSSCRVVPLAFATGHAAGTAAAQAVALGCGVRDVPASSLQEALGL